MPQTDLEEVRSAINETLAMTNVLRVMGSLPIVNFQDVAPAIKRLKIGAELNANELGNILLVLRIATDVKRFLADHDELDLSALDQLQQELVIPEKLYKRLKDSLEADGTILDTASSALVQFGIALSGWKQALSRRWTAICTAPRVNI